MHMKEAGLTWVVAGE